MSEETHQSQHETRSYERTKARHECVETERRQTCKCVSRRDTCLETPSLALS